MYKYRTSVARGDFKIRVIFNRLQKGLIPTSECPYLPVNLALFCVM